MQIWFLAYTVQFVEDNGGLQTIIQANKLLDVPFSAIALIAIGVATLTEGNHLRASSNKKDIADNIHNVVILPAAIFFLSSILPAQWYFGGEKGKGRIGFVLTVQVMLIIWDFLTYRMDQPYWMAKLAAIPIGSNSLKAIIRDNIKKLHGKQQNTP
jgi:hypothetical protein